MDSKLLPEHRGVPPVAVDCVADNRMAQVRKVPANLVVPPG